jgi:hypothetical protein
MNINMKPKISLVLACVLGLSSILGGFSFPQPAKAQLSTVRTIIFPVIGNVNYSDDFGDARSGHTHEGNDLLGKKMMPLVAAVDGTVSFVVWPQATYGYMISISDADGYKYNYLHINNDNVGTDDGLGSGALAYAPGMEDGSKVVKGQLIGWMGDSGNAESTSPHLHFEIRLPDDTAFSPYQSLQLASHITVPVAAAQQPNELLPFGNFTGGGSLATGNLDKDSAKEVIVGAGPGGGPLVRRFEQVPGATTTSTTTSSGRRRSSTSTSTSTAPANLTNTSIPGDFYAYDQSFSGGIDVAAADTDGDGKAEIITAAGPGGGPHIKVFSAAGVLISQFFAYDTKFRGGVNVAAADLDGDGKAEIITGPKDLGGPHVKVFTAGGTLIREFMAYDPNFHGGVDVAGVAADSGKTNGLVVTAPGSGGGPHVKTFTFQGQEKASFMAYDPNFHGGLRVSAGKVGSTNKIATAPASGGGPDFKMFATDGTTATGYTAFEKWWSGGYDIAIGDTVPVVSSGPASRRVSVRGVRTPNSNGGDQCRRCQTQN